MLEFIKKLEKKYGEGIEQMIGYRNAAAKELEEIELVDERLESLETNLKAKEAMLFDSAAFLSKRGNRQRRKWKHL